MSTQGEPASDRSFSDVEAVDGWWRQVVELLHEGVVVLDDRGVIVQSNRSARRILGLSSEQILGRTSMDPQWQAIHADGSPFPGPSHPAMVSLATGQPVRDVLMGVRRPDGALSWILINSDLLRSPDGMQVVTSFVDVTRVRQVERLRLVAENAADAVVLASPTGVIEWVSPAMAHLLGWPPETLVGTSASTLIHFEDLPTYERMVAEVIRDRSPRTWEVRAKQADRSYRWVSAVSSPILSEDGALTGRVTTLRDIDQQVKDRQALIHNEETLRLAMAGAPHAMAVVALHGPILRANPALSELVNRDGDWLTSRHERELIHPDDIPADQASRDRLLAGQADYLTGERRLLDADGRPIWVQHSLSLVRDEHGMPKFYVSHFQDITEARRQRSHFQHQLSHDPLTGVLNREEMLRRIAHRLESSASHQGIAAVLYCDVDFFKTVNDTRGHALGDEVLKHTARRIAEVLSPADEVARLGGDEFVVLLADVPDVWAAVQIAEQIRAAVAHPLTVDGESVVSTLSVGVAAAHGGVQAQRLLRNADKALYQAKESGRDCTAVFNPS